MKKIFLFTLLIQAHISTTPDPSLENTAQKVQELLEQVTSLKENIEAENNNIKNEQKTKPPETASTKGLPAGWTRATLIVRESHLKKLKAVSYWDRVTIKSLVDQALNCFLADKHVRSINVKKR